MPHLTSGKSENTVHLFAKKQFRWLLGSLHSLAGESGTHFLAEKVNEWHRKSQIDDFDPLNPELIAIPLEMLS